MNSIDNYLSAKLDDHRKIDLFNASCEANRQGLTETEAVNLLLPKATEKDGLDSETAIQKIQEAFKQYPSEHGTKSSGKKVAVKETLSGRLIKLDLTPIRVPESTDTKLEQLRKYIEAVFKPGDHIRIDNDPQHLETGGKYSPRAGFTSRYEKIMEELAVNEGKYIFGTNEQSPHGGFVMINPLNGFPGAIKQEDIIDYRHVLVESDSIPIDWQMAALTELNLPISALVYSGSRSLHAVVKIDAGRDYDLYDKRVEFLFKVLHMARIRVDKQCKNSNRWTRLAGFKRKEDSKSIETMQYLVAVNMGASSWDEWEANMIEKLNGVSEPVEFSQLDKMPDLPVELVSGVLRRGEILLLSGPSKQGKSMLLIALGMALSSGKEWLGFQCKKSKVMYCNAELGSSLCINRVNDVGVAMGIQKNEYPLVQNLERSNATVGQVVKAIIRRIKQHNVDVVIIDPIYLLLDDEINAQEVKKFVRAINILVEETGVAVVYCHHSNKGNPHSNQSNHIDRISGSSVFARSTDGLLTFHLDSSGKGKLFFTLRSFRSPEPMTIQYQHPLFSVIPRVPGTIPSGETIPMKRISGGRKPIISAEEFQGFMLLNPKATAADIQRRFKISQSLAYEKHQEYMSAINIDPNIPK